MTLMQKISEEIKFAMKSGNKLRLETLRTVRESLLEKEVEKRPSGGMTPEDEISVLISASKKRKESMDIFRQNNRNDLADQEEQELKIIFEYLPKQLTEEEIVQTVKKYLQQTGANSPKDFGKVMPLVIRELKGKADGKLIQDIVKRSLGG